MNRAQLVCLLLIQALAVFVAAQAAATAQSPGTAGPQVPVAAASSSPASKAAEGLFRLDVVVTDKSGKPVSGLQAKDFTLLDNGQPGKILSFQAYDGATARPDPPAEVILFVDTINLSAGHAEFAQKEVRRFLQQNGGHLAEPVSIYLLTDAGLLVTPEPSMDGNALDAAITRKKGLRTVWQSRVYLQMSYFGGAADMAVHNGVSLTVLGSMVLEERRKPGSKLLIWVGDGWPVVEGNLSFSWITELSTRLREARIHLYSVTANVDEALDFDYRRYVKGERLGGRARSDTLARSLALPVLAIESGGRVLGPDKDLASQIDSCIGDASAYYTISFDPPRADQPDEYHELEMRAGNPELTARTNSVYYDEPVYYDQPFLAAQRMTVKQLEDALETGRGSSDGEMARQLFSTELTERMSSARLSSWKARLPGGKSWAALVALADVSAFLAPPPAEIPATRPPGVAAQREILSKMMDYLTEAIPRLPNFFATRTTVRYEEPPFADNPVWKTAIGDRVLHLDLSSSETILYRNGVETVDSATLKGKKLKADDRNLETRGVFGGILSGVVLDTAHGHLRWGRWEQGAGGPVAVFRYSIPKETSKFYRMSLCCLTDMDGSHVFQSLTGYHGEIAIDPESGAILRMTAEADLEPNLPLVRSAVLVEYGPVEIGAKTYICPLRSVSLSRGRSLRQLRNWNESYSTYGQFETILNDVAFSDYHMFRSESRILVGDNPAP